MKRCGGALGVVLGLAALGAALGPARADERAVRRELEAKYAFSARAHTAPSIAGMVRFLREDTTPDFVFKGPRRTHTRQQELATYQPVRQGKEPWAPAREFRTHLDRLTLHGVTAIAVVTDRAKSIVRDPRITGDPAGKPHVLAMERTNRDLWIKTRAGWKLNRREVVSGKQALDARPFTQPPALRPRS